MHAFDLDAYLDRIGYDGSRAPTRDVHAALALAHVQAIAFENLDPLLGRGVRLDLESLQAKLVHGRRGDQVGPLGGRLALPSRRR